MTLLKVDSVSKYYGRKKAVDKLSFTVNRGEIVGLLGKNGAGKTTIMKSICGSLKFNKGDVLLDGVSTQSQHPFNKIGVLIESSFYDHLNTFENLKSLMLLSGETDKNIIKNRIDDVLNIVGLENEKKSYVSSFSFGMKQRLGLAQSLLGEHDLLILDEPFVGLDPPGRELVKSLIVTKAKKDRAGILFSSHNIRDVLEISDRIVIIDDGLKTYDGEYYNNKFYDFTTKQMSSLALKDLSKDGFETTDTSIKVMQEGTNLKTVMKRIKDHDLEVENIEIIELSLDQYFSKEVKDVT